MSKDVEQYNACPHECLYCYANKSKERAKSNYKKHTENKFSEIIIS